MTKDRFAVVLGGTIHQEQFVREIEEYGYTPLVLDGNRECHLAKKGIKFIECDISSPNKCAEIIENYKVEGCFTGQSDIGVPAMGKINDKYGLIGITFLQAEMMSNKYNFRKQLEENGIFQPKFRKVESKIDVLKLIESCGYPIVIKPVDSSGSRGFSKITCSEEIDEALQKANAFTKKDYVIGEEFIEGIEFGAQVYSVDGSVKFSHLHTDWTIRNVPVGHCMPVQWEKKLENRVQTMIKDCIYAIGHTGPSNVDLIIDANENIYVLEIGGRIGATCLPELVKMSTGVDLFQIQVGIALGVIDKCELNNLDKEIYGSGVRILSSNVDIHSQITESQIRSFLKQIKSKFNLYELEIEGDISNIRRIESGTDRFGKILYRGFVGEKADSIEERLDNINELVCDYLVSNS